MYVSYIINMVVSNKVNVLCHTYDYDYPTNDSYEFYGLFLRTYYDHNMHVCNPFVPIIMHVVVHVDTY